MAKTITVDGVEYVKKSEISEYSGDIKIVILQRGWILIGKMERNGSDCKLHHSSVIRSWGTSKGLGEIADNGPLTNTRLDKCYGTVEFDYATVVAAISVNQTVWASKLSTLMRVV